MLRRGDNAGDRGVARAYVCGTLDSKATELGFIQACLEAAGVATCLVDLGTSGEAAPADVAAREVAAHHPKGEAAVFTGDRGSAVGAMAEAFARFVLTRDDIGGMIGAGGSGNTALVTPAMRALPVGVPKVMVSTVASGNVAPYVGPADILMLHAVADVQGLNAITRRVLGNAAHALAGMMLHPIPAPAAATKPAIGLTMFGVTTSCVQQVTRALEADYDCLVFHATGTGGQALEKLVASGLVGAMLDITTTEIADLLVGGVLPATEDRLEAVIQTGIPYVGSLGALDMVNFGAMETVPERFRDRRLYVHNPQVTLMRTTVEENARFGAWLAARLNRMEGPVRFLVPEGGVSAIDAPGQPFFDPDADAALFAALEAGFRPAPNRRLARVAHNINDAAFAAACVAAFHEITRTS
jgi:uncharacterized protein (UPF0261 family)